MMMMKIAWDKVVNGEPDRKWRKGFYRAEQFQGRVSAATSNKPKLGQEEQLQMVKQTPIGTELSHFISTEVFFAAHTVNKDNIGK